MSPFVILAILAGLVALATGLGVLWMATTGRVKSINKSDVVSLSEVPLRSRATLLQFSTEVCAPCVPTRALLGSLAGEYPGVQHIDLDVTHRPELASRFKILQTPTTLILDRGGVVRARIGGAPRRAEIRTALEAILTA